MSRYELEYGRRTLPIDIDPARIAAILEPSHVDEAPNVREAVVSAISSPIDSPPLREVLRGAKTALILTVDHTRPSPAPLIEPVLDICEELGVAVTVCVATGRHRLMTDAELGSHFPEDLRSRVTLVQHDAFDDGAMRDVGVTERGTPALVNKIVFQHDVVIGAGILEPSYLCGFSGGRKLILPGIAHHTTVDANHYWLTQPGAGIGTLDGNPVSEDAAEVARLVPFHFIVYSVSGPNDEVVEVVAGDPFAAHEEGCRRAADMYRAPRATGDIVISSAGGYPYDCDLVQAKKAIVPAGELVNEGGVVVLLGECIEGLGAEETFLGWLRTKTPQQVVRDAKKRELFNLGAHGANILAKPIAERNARVILVTRPEICEELAGTYVEAVPSIEEALALAQEATSPEASVVLVRKARRLIVSEGDP